MIIFLRKIVGCCTQIEAKNITVRYLEIFFKNEFEILFDDGACLAKNDISWNDEKCFIASWTILL